jgi:hypothetical protein
VEQAHTYVHAYFSQYFDRLCLGSGR